MSLANALLPLGLTVTGRSRRWRNREALLAAVARREPWPAPAPRLRGVTVSVDRGRWPVVRIDPPSPDGRYVHFHGGGYVFGPAAQHWTALRALALASGRGVVAPLYRLAPEGVAAETIPEAVRIVAELAAEEDVVLGGDSAGGGLALAVAQQLAADGSAPPLALIAPWVDGSLADDATRAADRRDPWLSAAGLRAAADLYRGDLDVRHPFVSPITGTLAGLGPVTLLTGTRDVLHPQALRLGAALDAAGVPTRLVVGEGLLHNFPFLPVPDARPGRRVLADLLRSGPSIR